MSRPRKISNGAKHVSKTARTVLIGSPSAPIAPVRGYTEEHAAALLSESRRDLFDAERSDRIDGARGRIAEPRDDGKGVRYNKAQRIDGARLLYYNEDSESVRIRIDNSDTPSFWIELDLPLNQLRRFTANQIGANAASDDDDEEEEEDEGLFSEAMDEMAQILTVQVRPGPVPRRVVKRKLSKEFDD